MTINKAHFARLCQIKKQTVNDLVNHKKLGIKDGKVNLKSRKTLTYLSEHGIVVTKENIEATRKPGGKPSGPRPVKVHKNQHSTKVKEKEGKTDDKADLEQAQAKLMNTAASREKLEIERLQAQTMKLQLEVAKELKKLIPMEIVEDLFRKISNIIAVHFLTIGERLAPQIAGEAGTTDVEIIIKIKSKIDDDIGRSLEEFKSAIQAFIDSNI